MAAALPASAQPGRVLTVGAGAQFGTLQAALDRARDGDRVDILPGVYRGSGALIHGKLHLRGLGAGAIFETTGRPPADRGVLVVQGEVTIENLGFRGARRSQGNGAGIRFLDGRLEVRDCTFVDNEMGLLGSDQADAELKLKDCIFGGAPRHAGRLHHLLYASTMARLEVEGCRFEGGWRGHLLKSRARVNIVRYNLLRDGPQGGASYELELAEGGDNSVVGNIIVQSAQTQNRSIVAIGYNAHRGAPQRLTFAHNTVVNQAWWPAKFLHVWDQALPGPAACAVAGNLFIGRGDPGIPAGCDRGGNHQWGLDALEGVEQDRFLPRAPCPHAGAAGTNVAPDGLPRRQFELPRGTRERAPDGCPGARSG